MSTISPEKKSVDTWLNEVLYETEDDYVPSTFGLEFINFIKLVNGGEGEENKTPVLHYKMLDQITGKKKNIANMLFRGSGKTTLMSEYLILYLAVYGNIPGFGEVSLGLYVSDSIENGVKNLRKNLEYRWENSDFLKKYVPKTRFTDIRWEFTNIEGKVLVFKGYGARALSLDTRLYTETGYTTIKDCQVGDLIYGPDGKLAPITAKSEVFSKPMYRIDLADGRYLKVSEDHINSVMINTNPNNIARWENKDLTTKELLKIGWLHTKKGNKNHKGISNKCTLKIQNTAPLDYLEKELPVDPYTLGLILGDGSIKKKASGIVITGQKRDTDVYRKVIPYELGEDYLDKRTKDVITFSIRGINQKIRDLSLDVHGNNKFIPEIYFFGSIKQRLDLLKGLLDTDGDITKNSRVSFASASERLAKDVMRLVRSLGGKAIMRKTTTDRKNVCFRPEIWLGMNPFFLARKAQRFINNRPHWDNVNIINISRIPDEPSQCIAINNSSRQFIAGEYVRTHNTGVRGSKEMGKRPVLAILDDLISDEDARSKTVISSVEDTVYKAINYALHPTRNKIIWSGTPFNASDPLYKAVESGAWWVNVYPVCEEFPCKPEEFKGAWEDRFTYEYVNSEYKKALATGQIHSFNQELMLRIMSDEDRVILDSDIIWYRRSNVLSNRSLFNFYITTDFATSSSSKSDYSVISVWAYNHNGDWLWVDGICKRQLMDKNVDDLFRFAQEYRPQLVGIEVSGQQGGFVSWIQDQMMVRNIYFPLASEGNNTKPGIRPNTNKIQRFNVVVPWFKAGKMWFPEEKRESPELMEMMEELSLVTVGEFKSKHDDALDTISMLGALKTWKPSQEVVKDQHGNDIWEDDEYEFIDQYSSYIV